MARGRAQNPRRGGSGGEEIAPPGLPERLNGVPPGLPERLNGVPPGLPERLDAVPAFQLPFTEENTATRRLTSRVGSRDGEVSRELLDACRLGDRDALRALYEAYKDRVYSIAFYFFRGDATAASDVTQQVFLKLIDGMAKYRGDSAFSTWLYRIVVNACVDRSRRWRAEAATEPAVLDEMPGRGLSHEELFARGELARSVQDAIAALPPKLRLPILLRYFDELSYAEMAAALHCSIGTISSRLSRGHRLLARRLAPVIGGQISEPGVKR